MSDHEVNINIFSGRRSSQDNLSCDIADGKISKIQPGVTLCGLIGEYDGQNKATADSPSQPVPARGNFTHK